MDFNTIKKLIKEGRPISEMRPAEAFEKMNNEVLNVYIMSGVNRNMTGDMFPQEVRICAKVLCDELTTDPAYRSIRDKEIPYIFSSGIKGRIGTDRDIFITPKTIIRWIEAYVTHQARQDAINSLREEKRSADELQQKIATADDNVRRMVMDAWSDYKKFKNGNTEESCGTLDAEVKIFGLPISCRDYGHVRIDYLRRIGYAASFDSLIDVFESAYRREHPEISEENDA